MIKNSNNYSKNKQLEGRTATIKILVSIMFILFLCSFISAATWSGNISTSVQNVWNFDSSSGTNASDSVGGLNFAFAGANTPTWVTGKFGNGLKVLGDTGDAYGDGQKAHNLSSAYTLAMWVNTTSYGSDNTYWQHSQTGIPVMHQKGGNTAFLVDGTTNKVGNSSPTYNQWAFIVWQYDRASGVAKIWLNGNLIGYFTGVTANPTNEDTFLGRGIGYGVDCTYDNTITWTRILTEAEISLLWNNGNGCAYGNESCFGEANSREINLISPINGIRIGTTQTNLSANYSSGLYNFTNTTYYIWHDNGTLFNSSTFSLTSNTTNSSMNFSGFLFDDYIWNVRACVGNGASENCSMATSNYTFQISPFSVNNISYPLTSLETSTQVFHINISAISGISSVTGKFWINGASRTANVTDGTAGIYKSYDTIDMPLNNATSNMTFFWQFDFTFSDSSTLQQNSSSYSTQVNRTIFQICNTTYPYLFVNFTTKSATNPFPLVNTTFKTAWNYWVGSGLVKRAYTHEDMNENLSSFAYCGSPNVTFYTNAHIEYDASAYALNSYFLNNASLTNTTNNISLYLLNNSLATVTVLKVVDNGQHPMEDVEIQILFYDVGTGTYYAVGIASTDFLGQDIVYLNWYDSLYKFILTKNGVVIKSTNTTKISESPVLFEIKDESGFVFDKFADFQYNLYFNDVTNNFVLTFTKPSGEVDEGCLRVVKRSASNDTQVCLICEESSSATLYCDISSAGNGTFVAAFYATGSLFYIDWISETIGIAFQETIYNLLGNNDATFYMFMIAGFSLAMLFVSPIFGIIGILIGLGAGAALGFTLIDYGEFIGIILLGGIIVWILKR